MDENVAQVLKEFEGWMVSSDNTDHKWKSEKLPRLILSAGKTHEEVENDLDNFSSPIKKTHLPYRGFTIPGEKIREIVEISTDSRPIWFVYSGVGCYWPGMGQQLILIPAFKKIFGECAKAVEEFNMDLFDLIQNPPKNVDIVQKSVLVTAMQLTLTELLIKLNIHPAHFIGMSLSEICCGFADEKISKEQAMKLAYYRGFTMAKNSDKIQGAGAMVFASMEKIREMLLPGVYLTMLGGPFCSGISGDLENIKKMAENFEKENIICKITDDNRAFHSPKMNALRPELLAYNKTIITKNLPRSEKWVTSVETDDLTCSAEFFTDGPCNPVRIHEANSKIPGNALIVEVGPWAQIENMLKQFMPEGYVYVGLVKRRKPELIAFLESIGKLYINGCDIDLSVLQ